MIGKAPAFQFYPDTYLSSLRVQLMTLAEEGAYLRLICYCWRAGSLPSDPVKLATIVGKGATPAQMEALIPMFVPGPLPGTLIHERLEQEKVKQAHWREKSSEGGRKSAAIRKGGSTKGQPDGDKGGDTFRLQSPSPSSENTSMSNGDRERSPATAVVLAWNAKSPPLPAIVKLTHAREQAVRVRLRDEFWRLNYAAAIERAAKSDFLLGRTDRGTWRMDFNFFLKPDSVAKILEGKYDNRTTNAQSGGRGFEQRNDAYGTVTDKQ